MRSRRGQILASRVSPRVLMIIGDPKPFVLRVEGQDYDAWQHPSIILVPNNQNTPYLCEYDFTEVPDRPDIGVGLYELISA